MKDRRKVRLLDGEIHTFFIKGEKNPCGCGSNCFHYENDEVTTYGVCNACDKDIYIYKEKEEFEEWEYKIEKWEKDDFSEKQWKTKIINPEDEEKMILTENSENQTIVDKEEEKREPVLIAEIHFNREITVEIVDRMAMIMLPILIVTLIIKKFF